MNPVHIDVVTDIVCPWCYVGLTRLDRALAASGAPAAIVHHPFFLDPNVPEEGVDVPTMLRAKYGADPAAMFARVEAEASRSGLALDLSLQPRQRPTARAHTLVRAAAAKGMQHALAMALFEAHFMQARNIADVATLADIAAQYGFPEEETRSLFEDERAIEATREAAASASASGIRGVPFFIFGRRLTLSGAQPEEALLRVIEQARGADPAASV